MTDNLKLWDSVSRVPKEHLKAFDRGTFKGTAIKPAWAYKAMTEHAGPCGEAWSIGEPAFTLVDGVKGEKLVYCVVTVNYKGGNVVGVGGDKVIKYTAANDKYGRAERWDNDDEAFKKSYTDALTNALVKLGVGADIHMGLWDGNKYVDQKSEEQAANDAPDPMGKAFNASKADTRPIKDALCKAIDDCPSKKALEMLGASSDFLASLQKLNDDLKQVVRESYSDKMKELLKGLAA